MLTDEQARIAVDSCHPIERPLVGFELCPVIWNVAKVRRFSGTRIEVGFGLVPEPAGVVILGGPHRRSERTRPLELLVAPVRSEQAGQLGVIILRDHHQRSVRFITYDHTAYCADDDSRSLLKPPCGSRRARRDGQAPPRYA